MSMLLLFLSASVIASSSVIGSWFVTSTPTRLASGSGRAGAWKFGATGGGSAGRTAGATPPVAPTPVTGDCWITVFGLATPPVGGAPGNCFVDGVVVAGVCTDGELV